MCIKPFKNPKTPEPGKRWKVARFSFSKSYNNGLIRSICQSFIWQHGKYNKANDYLCEENQYGFHCCISFKQALRFLNIIKPEDFYSASSPFTNQMIIMEGDVKHFLRKGKNGGFYDELNGTLVETWEYFRPKKYYDHKGNDITKEVLSKING